MQRKRLAHECIIDSAVYMARSFSKQEESGILSSKRSKTKDQRSLSRLHLRPTADHPTSIAKASQPIIDYLVFFMNMKMKKIHYFRQRARMMADNRENGDEAEDVEEGEEAVERLVTVLC